MAVEQLRGNDCISELFEEPGVVCTIEARSQEGLHGMVQPRLAHEVCVEQER